MDKKISIVTVVFLVLTFFFGDNIIDKLRTPVLMFSTIKIEFKNGANNIESDELNLYRQITISNVGAKPSVDVSVLLHLDGVVYDYDISSIDQYKITSVKGSVFKFTMPRLTKGAFITLKLWMKGGGYDFNIQATDNQESIEFVEGEQLDKRITTIQYVSIFLLFPLLVYIIYIFKYKPLLRSYNETLALYKDLSGSYSLLDAEKHDLELRIDELSQYENKSSIVDDLAEFLRKHNKN